MLNSVTKVVPDVYTLVDIDVYTVDDIEPLRKAKEIGGGVTTGGEAEKSEAREVEVAFVLVFADPMPWKGAPTVEFPAKPCAIADNVAALDPDE